MREKQLEEDLELINQLKILFEPKVKDIVKKINSEIVSKEYYRGGGLPRGYYDPTLILDIIVGNISRGKIIKRKSKNEPDFVFGFNIKNELIYVNHINSRFEYIFNYNGLEIGLHIRNDDFNIVGITICKHKNGKIIKKLSTLYNSVEIEKYYYTSNNLIVDTYYSFLKENVIFNFIVENDNLISYKFNTFRNEEFFQSSYMTYEVKPVRNICFNKLYL